MPRRIRVLFIGKDASRGGTMRELGYLLKYLDKQRFEPLVFLSRGGDLLEEYKRYADVHVFQDHRAEPQPGHIAANGSHPHGILTEFLEFRRDRQARARERTRLEQVVAAFGPDLLVWHYHFPIQIFDSLHALGIPGIQHVQQRFAALATMSERELSRFFSRAQTYVCEGNGVRNELETLAGVAASKIRVIPMPIDADQISKDSTRAAPASRAELGISENAILVGTVASILFVKAPDLLLKAAKHLRSHYPDRDIHFLWVGGHPHMFKTVLGASVMSLAAEYGLTETVHFIGDRRDVYPYLELLDIYAHPARVDAFPHAVLEAMALNKPAVSFRLGLAEEDFSQDAMLIAENFDPIALAQAIVRLADSPSLRREMGERGRKLVLERFDAKKNIPQYESLLEETLSTAKGKLGEIKVS